MGKPNLNFVRTVLSVLLALLQIVPAGAESIIVQDGNVNGHSNKNIFNKENILDIVPKGTRGDVLDHLKFPSGNYAIQISISRLGEGSTSLKPGDKVWVYYHMTVPRRRIQLLDDSGKKVEKPSLAISAEALSTFKIAHSVVPHEEVCKECENQSQAGTKPLPDKAAQPLSDVANNVNQSIEKKTLSEIPEMDVATEEVIAFITKNQPKKARDEKANRLIAESLKKECAKWKIPISLGLALMKKESDFDPHAVSPAGAIGLMQLMPNTIFGDFGISDEQIQNLTQSQKDDYIRRATEPSQNIKFGIAQFGWLLKSNKGNVTLALRKYNFGEGNYHAYLHGTCARRNRNKQGVCILPKETRDYAPKILAYASSYLRFEMKSRTSLTFAKN